MHPTIKLTGAALGAALPCLTTAASAADAQPGATPQAASAFSAETTLNAVTVVGNGLWNPNETKVLEHPDTSSRATGNGCAAKT
ncbi:hypothetical protein P3W85_06610 [Cupriavidus basilensis]|uniref:Uncharacterized protein n=1 Tax=Cupriavidus basilensis TaxID=68895 RepID=A0ABT6ALF2_9BURK|nr:hypothetical protein [Cupriavidus basilensis]MDF3832616.1 hypothetical protein [Cupriavidus basilensis]